MLVDLTAPQQLAGRGVDRVHEAFLIGKIGGIGGRAAAAAARRPMETDARTPACAVNVHTMHPVAASSE